MNVPKVLIFCRYVLRLSEETLVLGGFEIKYIFAGDNIYSSRRIAASPEL